jgi:hypothetical protein
MFYFQPTHDEARRVAAKYRQAAGETFRCEGAILKLAVHSFRQSVNHLNQR